MRLTHHPVVLGGLLVGVLDIAAAFAFYGAFGVRPIRILQGIASGLLGRESFGLGLASAALGLALHFVIAFGAATVYYLVSRRWRFLVERPILSGIAYGVVVYAVMNRVVLPLSRGGFRLPPWYFIAGGVLIHVLCVGLPIALAVHYSERRGRRDAPTELTG